MTGLRVRILGRQSHRFAHFVLPISSLSSQVLEVCQVALNPRKITHHMTESRISATWSRTTPAIWKKTTNRSKTLALHF
jgi:hypothetical protein